MNNEERKSRGKIAIEKLFSSEEIGVSHPEPHPDRAIRIFLDVASSVDYEAFTPRWIQMPRAVLLHQMVRNDPNFGVIVIYDRETGDFYTVSFEEDEENITVPQFAELLSEYDLLQYATCPGLLRDPVQLAGKA